MLPLSVQAEGNPADLKFDKNDDGIINRSDWRRMKADEKKTYARLSLEAIGENPGAIVKKDVSRETLLLQALEKIYGR